MGCVSLIAAMDRRGVIGRGDALPWRLPEDLRRFRALTMGKAIMMGRRTHESIGRPLDGRRNLVLSRDPAFRSAGCEVVASLDEGLRRVESEPEVMIIGGAELYAQALPFACRIYLTRLDEAFEGDVYFPAFSASDWIEVGRESVRSPGVSHPHVNVTLKRS